MLIDVNHLTLPTSPTTAKSWGRLSGSAEALAIIKAGQATTGFTLIVARDSQQVDLLASELSFFGAGQIDILSFPDWETLPYDAFSPHQDIISQRLETLYRLPELEAGIVILPITTLLHRLPPRAFVRANSLLLNTGQQLDVAKIRGQLAAAGYRQVDTVYEHGEFAVRGSLFDIFPMGSEQPYRIDLFDDEIEQLRAFDPETQRTTAQIEHIKILPAKEFPFGSDAIASFRQRWRATFDSDPANSSIYTDVSSGIAPPGIEYYLPLFFDQCATLFDYLPEDTLLITFDGINPTVSQFWFDLNSRHEERRADIERPLLVPAKLYLTEDELFGRFKQLPRLNLSTGPLPAKAANTNASCLVPPDFEMDHHEANPLAALAQHLKQSDARILFCAESAGRREVLLELLKRAGIKPVGIDNWNDFLNSDEKLGITIAEMDRGLHLEQPEILLICESQLFGRQVLQKRRREKSRDQSDQFIKNLAELQLDMPVVHIDHGVGRYRGLETISLSGLTEEFMVLEYAADAKLYVPISSLHLITRYTGAGEEASTPLHHLGSDKWQKAKRKAAERIHDTAVELLEINARRAAKSGIGFDLEEADYLKFCADFPFEETPDQMSAINATITNMTIAKPMDRLICGDVGFGKTEVAMRAAFIAAQNSYQVAVLVPTTLLAQQHYESFRDRFADWPVNIDVISRFKTKEEQKRTLKQLESGQLDIVIGTHKLITADINFHNLGLLIIDEEHRFGVRQKEKIKALRTDTDILAMTATPIPRTLNMAMSGIRDISIIVSPPEKRLSIKTFIARDDKSVRKEAVSRELMRGGQVYFLHNEVSSIERCARELAELVPEARIGIAHGQMRERKLEQVMSDFYHKRFNLLVCSSIIETGIDVPSANTIVIERADKFGLAQLHQLRGRVGRSHHQAYAYLLIPDRKSITADAVKRLDAVAEAQELGAGFTLASHDLEIRGAGELLGDNQSGHIHAIGFSLYADLLQRAVDALKQGKALDIEKPMQHGAEINLHIPALIPDTYLPDIHTRLVMYKRIAGADDDRALDELKVEMIDRFGLLTDAINNLFDLTSVKIKATGLGIRKLDLGQAGGSIEFEENTKIEPAALIQLIQSEPGRFKLNGADRLKISMPMSSAPERFEQAHTLLDQLASGAA